MIERYYLQHKQEFDEKEQRVKEDREEQIRLQRLRFPPFEGYREEHIARFKELVKKRRQETNGEGHPGGQ